MSDRTQIAPSNSEPRDIFQPFQPLPTWLSDRVLHDDEQVAWVYGPKHNPSWERYITHPLLFLFALPLAASFVGIGRATVETWSDMPIWAGIAAGAIVFGSIFVLALSCAYFTRLVVTNNRLVILQGYEECRSWGMNDLPDSLLRYTRRTDDGRSSPTVDLDALKTMLGGASEKFAESKTILAFGKQLDRIKTRDTERQ